MIFVFVVITAVATAYAALYTHAQWVIIDDQEKRSIRAYVALRDIRFEKLNDTFYDIIPEWENTGNSQTVRMQSRIYYNMSDIPLPEGFNLGELGDLPIGGGPPVPIGGPSVPISLGQNL